jgi:hypothetical protein
MKKQTYHSNSRYKVCARVISDSPELMQEFVKISGNNLEL